MSGGPVLSVIVPVRNEASHIGRCLESILADAPAGGIEVIVVDGLSDDGTADIARELARRSEGRVRVLENPSRFVPLAMNLGIAAAGAPYIGRIDGHCLVERGYFDGCLERLGTGRYDCVGGTLVNEGTTPAGRAIAAATSSAVGVGSARFRTGRGGESLVDTLAFGVYRREVFERIGLFDEAFVRNQDDELNLRLIRAGGKILLIPSLRIRYFVRESLRRLARQYFQYGYWKWKVFRKHGALGSWRQLAPPVFVALLGLSAAAAPVSVTGRFALAALLVPWLAVIGLESARLAWRRGVSWWTTALALGTLHLSYGWGVLTASLGAFLPSARRPAAGPTDMSR